MRVLYHLFLAFAEDCRVRNKRTQQASLISLRMAASGAKLPFMRHVADLIKDCSALDKICALVEHQ